MYYYYNFSHMPIDNRPMHTWSCSHEGCKKYIACYTETALVILRDEHLIQHQHEQKRQDPGALARFRGMNPNKLSLNLIDIGFLKTRGIKIDDDIEVDLVSEPKPTKSELMQGEWSKILDAAWHFVPPKDENGNK